MIPTVTCSHCGRTERLRDIHFINTDRVDWEMPRGWRYFSVTSGTMSGSIYAHKIVCKECLNDS